MARKARSILTQMLVVCACLLGFAPAAQATPSASLHVAFAPERLGHSTTIELTLQIAAPAGQILAPLTQLDILYPATLGVDAGELGLASCPQTTLEVLGPAGCPPDSRMGSGSALAEIPIGLETLHETAQVAVLRAPEAEEHLALLLYATGTTPVFAQIAFPGLLLPAPAPYGARIHITVPLIPGLPGGPNVSLLRLYATLGPLGLTYYEHVHSKLVPYKPRGILLPRRCPHHGFAFNATFTFQDGSQAHAHAVVPCPR